MCAERVDPLSMAELSHLGDRRRGDSVGRRREGKGGQGKRREAKVGEDWNGARSLASAFLMSTSKEYLVVWPRD